MQPHNMPILSQAGIYIPGVCRDLTGINSLGVEGKVQPLLKNREKLTSGDIILADLSQYIMIDKGGLQSASSIHVKFTTDETAFRFVFRVNPSAPYAGNSITKQFPKRGNLNPEMDMAIPCQAAINHSQACVETIQEPTYFN